MKPARKQNALRYCLVVALAVNSIMPASISAGDWSIYKFGKTTTVDKLAKKIEHVQHRLDKYGTIATKAPDVWGESRLLQHREDFEKEFVKDLAMFRETLQGAESTRDSAFLASALSLSNVLGTPVATSTTSEKVESNTQIFVEAADKLIPNSNDLNSNNSNLVQRSTGFGPQFANKFTTGVSTDEAEELQISIEPTTYLDQKKRYLDHLNALRRLNEGDDTADSPGYALNLLRIPVSVLPGRETRKGYGAQVSITVDPYASEELLPEAFRNFVINGVVDEIAPVVTKAINNKEGIQKLEKAWRNYVDQLSSDLKKAEESEEKSSTEVQPDFEKTLKTPREDFEKRWSEVLGDMGIREGVINQLGSSTFLSSKRAYPPSLYEAVSGTSLAVVAISAYNQLHKNAPIIHLEDVRRYLGMELQASYDLLSQQNAIEKLWYDAKFMDEIRVAVLEDRYLPRPNSNDQSEPYKRLSQLRAIYYSIFKKNFPGARFSTIEHLGWHILVESVMLDKRLREDMKSVAANKNCCQVLDSELPFYGPNPPIEARYAFKEYVRCRWPIQVFALDPVTDDQNIGEAFSQRRELQLALAVAASKGIFGMQNLNRFVRRMEYDLETIQLNRTAIGFAHGNDTFGWRFYPRVQAAPVPGSIKAFGETLLGGQSREKRLTHQMLEPAMRECSALIVMPSFIPYITVDVQSNWFKLSPSLTGKVFKRKLDLTDAVELSKDVTELKELACRCKKDEHLYRDGVTHRLLRAVDQIERQLPLQTSYVQIPYENNLSGFEIFNNGVTDLGPELIDWYGATGIIVGGPDYKKASHDIHESSTISDTTITTLEKRVEREISNPPTTLFLIGKNFTSLGEKTRIIAGGVDVSDSRKLVSRNVLQVTVPSHVMVEELKASDKSDFPKYVDVHIATPHGVTSQLMVPAIENAPTTQQVSMNTRLSDLETKLKAATKAPTIEFEWMTTSIDGCLDLFDTPVPRQIDLAIRDDVKLKVNAAVFPPGLSKIKLLAKVEISKDGKKFVDLIQKNTGKESLIEMIGVKVGNSDVFKISSSTGLEPLLQKVIESSTLVNNDVKAIKLSGVAQMFLQGMLDTYPLYSVKKSLTINLERCQECPWCIDSTSEATSKKTTPSTTKSILPPPPKTGAPLPETVPPKPVSPPAPVLKAPSSTSTLLGPPISRPIGRVMEMESRETKFNTGFSVSISP
ncbi:hypothetical protein Pan153_24630 [Gimesia panareensis]|uniref:Uncharacterized protein n=1 Tax=Gimesia panareensis TaxID=2527978 RepID=A0A518FN74_9PLAN|nr:hypothetical protein [Gimesia panareensis]QDV17808.1 hypothetical protein Pan153_24630 [Gimesia panareensis]